MIKPTTTRVGLVFLTLAGCSVPDATSGTDDACELTNASTARVDGGCVVLGCDEGFEDCDRLDSNGCEVHTTIETDNCGACGVACVFDQAEGTCEQGVCSMGSCVSGFEDCDDDEANGCEVQVATSAQNCGTCGKSCAFANASAACTNGQCEMDSCESGWADCDNDVLSGCEMQVATNVQNCGTCGNSCTFANASAACTNGQCQMGMCESGWADCDNDEANGCEVLLQSSSTNCGACGHDCLGGNCVTSACLPMILASGQTEPWSIAVNGTHVYWTAHSNPGAIRRVPRDGGPVQTLATSEALPDGIALTTDRVFWTNTFGGDIRSVPLGGGAVATVATAATGAHPAGIAVSNTHVFWTNWASGSVQRVALTGGSPEDLSTGNNLPHRIVTDGSYVWWANLGGNSVRRVDAAGGGLTTIADGQAGALGVAIDATHVFWLNQGDKAISRASFANGAIDVLATAPTVPSGIAVDDTHVYFTDGHPTGSVRRVPKSGGTVETLASDQSSPIYVAVDTVSIYWTNRVGGTIMRLAK